MNPCNYHDARRGFLKKSTAIAALYLTPSVFVKAFAVDSVLPVPIAKEKLSLTLNGKLVQVEVFETHLAMLFAEDEPALLKLPHA